MNPVSLHTHLLHPHSDGTALIMLHGWNRDLNDLLPMGELLRPARPIHLIDLPGFGESNPPDGDWDTKRYAERIEAYMREQKIASAYFLGHSFGGRISLRMATMFPDRVAGLILIGSHGLRPKRSLRARLRIKIISLLGKTAKLFDRWFGRSWYRERFIPRFGSPDYQRAGALRGTLVKTVTEDQTDDVQKIRAPALLIWGGADRETPAEMGRRFHTLLADSELIVIPHEGHDPFSEIGAHRCAFYINRFFDRLSTSAGRVNAHG